MQCFDLSPKLLGIDGNLLPECRDPIYDSAGELVCQAQNGEAFTLSVSTLFELTSRVIYRVRLSSLMASAHAIDYVRIDKVSEEDIYAQDLRC